MRGLLIATLIATSPYMVAAQTPASAPAAAPAPATLAKARELIGVMHAEDLIGKSLDAQVGATTKGIAGQIMGATGAPASVTSDPEFQAIVQRFLDRIMSQAITQVKATLPQIVERMTLLYAQNFSVQEMGDLISFYRSPTGQVMLERTPALTAQIAEVTRDLTLGPIMKVVQQESPKFGAEVKAWAEKHPQAAGSK